MTARMSDGPAMTGAPVPLTVAGRRFLSGCAGGLVERTALVEVAVGAEPIGVDAAADRVRAAMSRLLAADPLPRVGDDDWPRSFLVADPGESPAARLGGWVVAMAVAVQRWGNDPVWRGGVLQAGPGRLLLAIPWRRQSFFDGAVDLALRWVSRWVWPAPEALEERLSRWLGAAAAPLTPAGHFGDRWQALRSGGLAETTLRFVQSAAERDMPFDVLPSYVQIGWGAGAERLDLTATGHTGWIANATGRNNWKTNRLLHRQGIPAPAARLVADIGQAEAAAPALGWPVLLTPLVGPMRGPVTAGISDVEDLRRSFEAFGSPKSPVNVVIEHRPPGSDHRLLVVHGRLLSAVRWGSGGEPTEVTALVPPDTAALARRVTRLVGLDIAELHVITADISRPWASGGLFVCAVKAQPDLHPHRIAKPGRDLEGEILDILFGARPCRIPVTAVTGGDHAGPTAELLQRIWSAAGVPAGVCTRTGLRAGADVYSTGDFAGLEGLRAILIDPGMRAAVVESVPDRVAAGGHPCDRYEVVGVFGALPDAVRPDLLARTRGALVVDADDPACRDIAPAAATARHVVVGSARTAGALDAHRAAGGAAVFVDADGWIVAADGAAHTRLLPWNLDRPVLFAAALAWAHGIDPDIISRTLGAL